MSRLQLSELSPPRRLQSEEIEFGTYNVGTGIETSFSRIVDIINQQLGTDLRATYVDNPIKNYVEKTKADISLAKSELGYEPKYRFMKEYRH